MKGLLEYIYRFFWADSASHFFFKELHEVDYEAFNDHFVYQSGHDLQFNLFHVIEHPLYWNSTILQNISLFELYGSPKGERQGKLAEVEFILFIFSLFVLVLSQGFWKMLTGMVLWLADMRKRFNLIDEVSLAKQKR